MEYLDVLDENGNIIGKEERSVVHDKGLWHIHVGVWLMNKKGELLLQRRSMEKKVNPGKWTRTGGHVDSGETPLMGIKRETKEEVGIDVKDEDLILMDIIKQDQFSKKMGTTNRTFVYSYFAFVDTKIEDCVLQKEEVSDVKYITIEELENLYNNHDENYTFSKWEDEYFKKSLEFFKEKRDEIID